MDATIKTDAAAGKFPACELCQKRVITICISRDRKILCAHCCGLEAAVSANPELVRRLLERVVLEKYQGKPRAAAIARRVAVLWKYVSWSAPLAIIRNRAWGLVLFVEGGFIRALTRYGKDEARYFIATRLAGVRVQLLKLRGLSQEQAEERIYGAQISE